MYIGIIGSGTMGNGIAHVFSLYKNNVLLVDVSETILDNAMKTIENNMKRQCAKNIINSNRK